MRAVQQASVTNNVIAFLNNANINYFYAFLFAHFFFRPLKKSTGEDPEEGTAATSEPP